MFGHSLLYRSIWELLQIALATYCFLTVKASYMPLKLSTKIASTIHPRWTAVNYSDILPPTTFLFLPSHSWPLIYKTHQYNHWKFYLIILMCRVFGTKFAYSQNKGSAYLSFFFLSYPRHWFSASLASPIISLIVSTRQKFDPSIWSKLILLLSIMKPSYIKKIYLTLFN